MPLPIYRLRRLLAATAIALSVVVAAMYFYARMRTRNVLKEVPNRIGYEIKQTANGFQFSKSDGKRTVFTIQANAVKQFRLNGRAELHGVSIILYGRDSSRYDQIYGDDFAYDPQTGDVTAKGDVQIDLMANPEGLTSPDQSPPKELKNPIHLKTRDLVFNRETGNAETLGRVEFQTPQASGWAVGVKYAGKSNTLTLSSHIHMEVSGANAAVIGAEHGTITGEPREIILDRARLDRGSSALQADQAVFYLAADNNVHRVVAMGNVNAVTRSMKRSRASSPDQTSADQTEEIRAAADQGEFALTDSGNLLRTATLSGKVHIEQAGTQPIEGDAGQVILHFTGKNELDTVHAEHGAHLRQKGSKTANASAQDFDLTASAIDFAVAQGHILERAVTSGPAQIAIVPAEAAGGTPNSGTPNSGTADSRSRTVVTAGRFEAKFSKVEGRNALTSIHGEPDARVRNSTPGAPDRVSTSRSIDAVFQPQGGIDSVTQLGNVAYSDEESPDKRTQAFANSARYTPADQILLLTGNPRVVAGAMQTTAKTIRINRATGGALAEGDVKSTYSDLKEQPDGALLASSSPIHVTSRSMTFHNNPGVALYTGGARLWQDANVIDAPSIQFDRERRFVTAQGTSIDPVQTILVQTEKGRTEDKQGFGLGSQGKKKGTSPSGSSANGTSSDRSSTISITAPKLTYADSERKIHYEGGVHAKGADFAASAESADAYLVARSQTSNRNSNIGFSGPGQLDHMVASGNVAITQTSRRAEGQQLVYTAADDKFILTGGLSQKLPSIFDAEQGKITGVSLTFFRRDDRVLVEGEASTPVVTQTRSR